MVWYCDTSALSKLVSNETESAALDEFRRRPDRIIITSELTISELGRAARRKGLASGALADVLLESVSLLALSRDLLETAAKLPPPQLRTLDALHLAAALSLGADCEGVVTYDRRMQQAATANGLTVVAPGQSSYSRE